LKDALSGVPCVVKDDLAALEIKFERPAMLAGIKVHGTAFVEVRGEESCKRRMLSRLVFIHVDHRCPHTTQHDRQKGKSSWSGRIEYKAGQSQFIIFTPYTSESECKTAGAFMEIRDISFTVQSTETGLSSQLAALFDNRAMLGAADDEVEVQLLGTEPAEAPSSLFVSRFVLQLRSPVFRAELRGGAFSEGRSRQLRFPDFPDNAVRCFMEVLHRDTYSGSPAPDELVAMFALGDKYDVPLVQELVYNALSELELSSAELRRAMGAIRRYRALPLRRSLLKKIRQLGDDEFCSLVYGDAEESLELEACPPGQSCSPHA